MAKVLVTGGAGFIGSHLCDRLVQAGDEVVVLDNFISGHRKNLSQISDKIHVIDANVLDILDHQDALIGIQRIYHLAALISGYDSLHEPEAYVESNITAILRVLQIAKQNQGCHIVFTSSSTVYGNQKTPVMAESTTLPNPLTMYAMSKLAGEQILGMYHELFGYTYTCTRLFNVYGPRQSPTHPYANVTCKFSQAAATTGNIKLYGTGEQSRDFVYVDDVVDALLYVSTPSAYPIYNVGTGEDASILTLIDHVSALRGSEMTVEQCPPWPNDIREIRADIHRLKDVFGFVAKTDLRSGLESTVQFFRQENHA